MKYLPLVFLLLLSGCSGLGSVFSMFSSQSSVDTAKDLYVSKGGTGIHLIQADAVNITTVAPVLSGSSFVVNIPFCSLSYDVASIDPVNYLFWLAQPTTLDFDPSTFACNTAYNCTISEVVMVGTIAEASFTCI